MWDEGYWRPSFLENSTVNSVHKLYSQSLVVFVSTTCESCALVNQEHQLTVLWNIVKYNFENNV